MSALKLEKVIELLQVSKRAVKVFPAGKEHYYLVPADRALVIAKSGEYQGIGSNLRVRYLRKVVVDRRSFPIDTSWWDGRSVFKYWPDQRTPGGGRPSSD